MRTTKVIFIVVAILAVVITTVLSLRPSKNSSTIGTAKTDYKRGKTDTVRDTYTVYKTITQRGDTEFIPIPEGDTRNTTKHGVAAVDTLTESAKDYNLRVITHYYFPPLGKFKHDLKIAVNSQHTARVDTLFKTRALQAPAEKWYQRFGIGVGYGFNNDFRPGLSLGIYYKLIGY